MKITYTENPLRSTVELDETDQIIFRLKIKIEELQDRLMEVHFSLTEDKHFDLDRAKKISNYDDFEEGAAVDKRVEELFNWYLEDLKGTHCGDCTCVPCSCTKCRAESILGIDTIKPFPGKHELANIDSAFSFTENGESKQRTLIEALKYLKNYKVSLSKPESWTGFTQEEYERHIPRWEAEGVRAYEYLKNYAREKFGVEEP